MRCIQIILIAALLVGCSRKPDIVFDFTTGFTLANAHWPTAHTDDLYEEFGKFHILVKTTDGLNLDVPDAGCYSILRNKGTLQNIVINFGVNSTLDQAYARAKQIMTDWHFSKAEMDSLEAWYAYKASPHPFGGASGFVGRATLRIVETAGPDSHSVYVLQILISR